MSNSVKKFVQVYTGDGKGKTTAAILNIEENGGTHAYNGIV